MSVDILGTSWDQCRSMVQYSFTSTETRRLVRTDSPGRPPRLSHSSWAMPHWGFWNKRLDLPGMGGADLSAVVPWYSGRATQISRKGQLNWLRYTEVSICSGAVPSTKNSAVTLSAADVPGVTFVSQACVFEFRVALRPQRPYGLWGTYSPGRPPRHSHSPWALKAHKLLSWCFTSAETMRLIKDRWRMR